jgi:cellulose biosynthesis protein BcsQ
MRTRSAKRFLHFVLFLIGAFAVYVAWSRPWAKDLVQSNESFFKLIGLGFGPVLALIGFFYGLVDKAEIKDITEELGKAKQAAEDERNDAERARLEVQRKLETIERLRTDLATIANAGKLWKLRENKPFADYRAWKYDPEGAKIVTFGLFKGGVGKTHLAANFAAYVSEYRQKPVLLIDLDYQGSLSTTVLTAADIEPVGSQVDHFFDENADLVTLASNRTHLAHSGTGVALNHGRGLAKCWLAASDYSLSELESKLLVSRVLDGEFGIDERYRLAHLLLQPAVRRDYSMIVIDTPPRMTLGTVNALVASHCYVVPTILDRVSSEAVVPFLRQVATLRNDLSLDLTLAGIIGTMTRESRAGDNEKKYLERTVDAVCEVEGSGREGFVIATLPRKVQVTNEADLAYFLSDTNGPLASQFYNPIFNKLWTRITGQA